MPPRSMPTTSLAATFGTEPDPGLTVAGGMATIMEQSLAPVPVLRLVTGSSVAETTNVRRPRRARVR